MAWKDDVDRETLTVQVFVNIGLSIRRARALADWLDNNRPVGVSGDFLAHLIGKKLDEREDWWRERLDAADGRINILLSANKASANHLAFGR